MIHAAMIILKLTRTAKIKGRALHSSPRRPLSMIHSANGPSRKRNPRTMTTLPPMSDARPVRPIYRPCTSCFHVDAMNPQSINNSSTTARGVPTMWLNRCNRSSTTADVPESLSAIATARKTRSHAAMVLQIAILSLAATSSALVNGRVAMNGVTP